MFSLLRPLMWISPPSWSQTSFSIYSPGRQVTTMKQFPRVFVMMLSMSSIEPFLYSSYPSSNSKVWTFPGWLWFAPSGHSWRPLWTSSNGMLLLTYLNSIRNTNSNLSSPVSVMSPSTQSQHGKTTALPYTRLFWNKGKHFLFLLEKWNDSLKTNA